MSSNAVFQNCYYIGNQFNGILYGLELVLYYMTMRHLLYSKDRRIKSHKFFLIFSTSLLILITIFVATQGVFGEEMWIVNEGYPGGSEAYLGDHVSVWYQTMGTAAAVLLNLLSDGYLVYRCLVVWNDYRVIIVPSFLWIATLGLGIAELFFSGQPSGDFFAGLAVNIGLAYYSTSIGLNVIVTSIIVARIVRMRWALHAVQRLSPMAVYTGTLPIIVESALPYSACGIMFLVSYGLGSSTSILFLSWYVMLTCVSPQMLVLRVLDGNAWTRQREGEFSGMALQTVGGAQGRGHDQSDAASKTDRQSDGSTSGV